MMDNVPANFRLMPGMTATAEIKVGKRRVIRVFPLPAASLSRYQHSRAISTEIQSVLVTRLAKAASIRVAAVRGLILWQ